MDGREPSSHDLVMSARTSFPRPHNRENDHCQAGMADDTTEVGDMNIKWLDHKKVAAHTVAWMTGGIPEQAGKDECMVCGKQIRKHRTVNGEGRICSSMLCAQYWAENMT
jgi:hypothetical protein